MTNSNSNYRKSRRCSRSSRRRLPAMLVALAMISGCACPNHHHHVVLALEMSMYMDHQKSSPPPPTTTTKLLPKTTTTTPITTPPPHSIIANVAVPEKVLDNVQKTTDDDDDGLQKSRDFNFYWVDKLDEKSSGLLLLAANHKKKQKQQRRRRHMTQKNKKQQRRPPFSLLSWNILSQELYEQSQSGTTTTTTSSSSSSLPKNKNKQTYSYSWNQRLRWILETILEASADVVCLQEVQFHLFYQDLLPALQQHGYDGCVQGDPSVREISRRKGKGTRRHVVATFWKTKRFQPVMVTESSSHHQNKNDHPPPPEQFQYYAHMARGRTLTCVLQDQSLSLLSSSSDTEDGHDNDDHHHHHHHHPSSSSPTTTTTTLAIINCHLEGHPRQYAARIQQLQHAMEDLAKRRTCGPPTLNGLMIAGDFNCELQSSACTTYLKIGRVGRKGGLGGVHGTSALVLPPRLLESEEAAEMLHPIKEWGQDLPNGEMEHVPPHPFRRNSLVSAYPTQLGQSDPRNHFTYCANPSCRPVAGLDQIWHSGYSLTRVALRKMLPNHQERTKILQQGLPLPRYPSDHLPIGAVLDWNTDDPMECEVIWNNNQNNHNNHNHNSHNNLHCGVGGVRELFVTQDQPPPTPKPKSPIMAYAELDLLLCTCPFDSDTQRQTLEDIMDNVPDLPDNPKDKPSKEQLKKLRDSRERKKKLLMTASQPARQVLQRILKLKKEVAAY